jgi:hypothetical protein
MTITPQRQVLTKFLLLLGLLVAYAGYLSYQYDFATGGIAALLSWSFFVLCTPVADAGFLLDFPLRLLFGIRMVFSEIAVWVIAVSLNLGVLILAPHYYETTTLTRLFEQILSTPYPYWGVIALSAAGTFLSVKFGDELMDVIHHRDRHFFHSHQFKHELVLIAFFVVVLVSYSDLILQLGLEEVVHGGG